MQQEDSYEALAAEYLEVLPAHDAAWKRWIETIGPVARKCRMTPTGSFVGAPTRDELEAEETARKEAEALRVRLEQLSDRLKNLTGLGK